MITYQLLPQVLFLGRSDSPASGMTIQGEYGESDIFSLWHLLSIEKVYRKQINVEFPIEIPLSRLPEPNKS